LVNRINDTLQIEPDLGRKIVLQPAGSGDAVIIAGVYFLNCQIYLDTKLILIG